MRKANASWLGSIAVLAILTAPVLASTKDQKTTEPQPAGEQSVSSNCRSYQQKPDGTWAALACQEVGAPLQPRPVVHSDATH